MVFIRTVFILGKEMGYPNLCNNSKTYSPFRDPETNHMAVPLPRISAHGLSMERIRDPPPPVLARFFHPPVGTCPSPRTGGMESWPWGLSVCLSQLLLLLAR